MGPVGTLPPLSSDSTEDLDEVDEPRGRTHDSKSVPSSYQQSSPGPIRRTSNGNGGSGERTSSLARAMSSVRNALGGRGQSVEPSASQERGRQFNNPSASPADRSTSRGRPPNHVFSNLARSLSRTTAHTSSSSRSRAVPTGRGGAGNLLPTSPSNPDPRAHAGEESDEAVKHARSASRGRSQATGVPSGRGGAGNIRSRSRGRELEDGGRGIGPEEEEELEAERREEEVERAAREKFEKEQKNKVFSTGRGGRGNVIHTN